MKSSKAMILAIMKAILASPEFFQSSVRNC